MSLSSEENADIYADVSVHILTYNNQDTIISCLESVLAQVGFDRLIKIRVRDNCSSDETVERLETFLADKDYTEQIFTSVNEENVGFSKGHNQMIDEALLDGQNSVLVLNPDLALQPLALSTMILELDRNHRAGMVCPKLLRADETLQPVNPPTLDAAGMMINKQTRHFDRGSQDFDIGQYDEKEFVFGASGAAVLLRKEFILDAAFSLSPLHLFDNAFFAYREDADLSWRSQLLGWRCLYAPEAIGYHQRVVLPERRKTLPKELNSMSVRNRFLLQFNNAHPLETPSVILPTSARNLLVIAAVLLKERSSLEGLLDAVKLLPKAYSKRKLIQQKRRSPSSEIAKWFSKKNYSIQTLTPSEAKAPIKSCRIIVINYNSKDLLGICLLSIRNAISQVKGVSFAVCIIDNASEDESAHSVKDTFNDFDFHLRKENLGFSGAINLGASLGDEESILILNPDTEINSKSLNVLLDSLAAYRSLAAVSPVLVNKDLSPQEGFTARRLPSVLSTAFDISGLSSLLPSNPVSAHQVMRDDPVFSNYLRRKKAGPNAPSEDLEQPILIEQPAGAAVLIRRTAFDEMGGFDQRFWPAWFEDVDFFKRLQNTAWQTAIHTQARVLHTGGYSLVFIGKGAFISIWYSNLLTYWKKHGTASEKIAIRALLFFLLPIKALTFHVLSLTNSAKKKQFSESAKATFASWKTILLS